MLRKEDGENNEEREGQRRYDKKKGKLWKRWRVIVFEDNKCEDEVVDKRRKGKL